MAAATASNDGVIRVRQWVDALCLAPTASPPDIARALDLDPATADRIGRQWIFTPPDGATYLEFVVDREGRDVTFLELVTSATLTAALLAETFGAWREAPTGPHQSAPTLLFDDLRPDGAARGCSVLARAEPGWPLLDRVAGIVLYLQPRRPG